MLTVASKLMRAPHESFSEENNTQGREREVKADRHNRHIYQVPPTGSLFSTNMNAHSISPINQQIKRPNLQLKLQHGTVENAPQQFNRCDGNQKLRRLLPFASHWGGRGWRE